jgi:demethylmenaquinone methyltransferase/2-methoxy-6-polyprenyl-1,4-benzoquinol methylase
MARATLDKRPADVARMFDAVAGRYDAMNAVMTFGQERRWRRVVARIIDPRPGVRVLDLAAGTGASSVPFAEAAFDVVTISFGLRNVADVPAALRELARVTRPGGRLVVLETSTPAARPLAAANRVYTNRVMPRLARLFSSDPASYAYLAESATAWLTQPQLAEAVRRAGWQEVTWRDLMFGAVTIHSATRPGPPPATGGATRPA